jgi:beta-glucosidase
MNIRSLRARAVAASLLMLAGCHAGAAPEPRAVSSAHAQPEPGVRGGALLAEDGLRFRDLNRNGRLDAYEDWRLSAEARADDLVARMTPSEKAGTMMHGTLPGIGPQGFIGVSSEGYDLAGARAHIIGESVTSFITRLDMPPAAMAEQNNAVQAIAEESRLGIPVTISTDPRHHFQYLAGASSSANGYSQWPETLGFAALRDPERVRRFADIARREYRASGIQQTLSPQADLTTEPRWPRGVGTFGSQPDLAGQMVGAYVEGFQGGKDGLSPDGVMAVVKHWVGYGATPDGWDGHNHYGRFARLDDRSFALHVQPFLGAFDAHVAAVMPTYSILEGVRLKDKALEGVGAGFNRQLLTDALRGTYGFGGIILSDWAIIEDCPEATCQNPQRQGPPVIGMPWGVEELNRTQRIVKAIDAGIDQFGGAQETGLLVAAMRQGLVDEARIDQSVRRILLPKFQMGLFENPYVDPASAAALAQRADFLAEGVRAQAESQVLLKADGGLRPLAAGSSVYLYGVDPGKARARGLVVVDDPAKADAAIIRLQAPSELLHPYHFFGSRQHEGRLDFRAGDKDFDALMALRGKTRIVAAVFLDRPAVLTGVVEAADVLLANFGLSDEALLDTVTGRAVPKGRLPVELPSSMAAVERQDPARPDDSEKPLFPYGAGL